MTSFATLSPPERVTLSISHCIHLFRNKWHELRMMHFNLLRSHSQQSDVVLEDLRLPEIHMRLHAVPPNCQHRSFALHTFPLKLFMRDPIRPPRYLEIAFFLADVHELRAALKGIIRWTAIKVECCNFGYRCTQGGFETTFWLKIYMMEMRFLREDCLESGQEKVVVVRLDEVLTVLLALPVWKLSQ